MTAEARKWMAWKMRWCRVCYARTGRVYAAAVTGGGSSYSFSSSGSVAITGLGRCGWTSPRADRGGGCCCCHATLQDAWTDRWITRLATAMRY